MALIPRLILIADGASPDAELLRTAAAVLDAVGRDAMVLDRDRPPSAGGPSDRVRLERLRALRELTRRAGAILAVTARVDLALAVGADGVQLPERGLAPADVRAISPALALGRSCHDREGLLAAARAGADWATLSPVRAPWSKPAAFPPHGPHGPLGVDGFRAAVAGIELPVFALGGVGPDLVPALRAAGAHGVATIGGLVGQGDPGACARALLT